MQSLRGRLLVRLTTIALVLGAGLLPLHPWQKARGAEKPPGPNVVIILADDKE